MANLLITLIVIVAILLILITAIQSSKKEGLESSLGNMGASQLIGVKKTGDLVEQTTWGLIILLFSLTLASSTLLKRKKALPTSPNIERAQEQSQLPDLSQEDKKEDTQ
jgi:preprotein translocase subunit SecG